MIKIFEEFISDLDPYGEEDWGDDENIYIHLDRPLGRDINYFELNVIRGHIQINQAENMILRPGGKLIHRLYEINNIEEIDDDFIRNFSVRYQCIKFNSKIPQEDIMIIVNRIYDSLGPSYKRKLERDLERVQNDMERLENKDNIIINL